MAVVESEDNRGSKGMKVKVEVAAFATRSLQREKKG